MLRPEQITSVKFTPVSMGTYSADEVDAFLRTVAESYDESLNQNKELIKKISILADKIESYRNDEDAIKLALLDAHRMAETINKNANTKAEDIMTDAETRSKIILDGANRQANQTIEEAKEKAKEIIDNARTAVASLTERAQTETESTIKAAQAKAEEIIAQSEAEGKIIIGNYKESYEFYSAELAKVKAETLKFKETIQELCKGQLSLLDGMPEFIAAVNAVSAVAEQVPEETVEIEEDIAEIPEEDGVAFAEAEIPAFVAEEPEIEEEISAFVEDEVAPLAEEASIIIEEEAPVFVEEEIPSITEEPIYETFEENVPESIEEPAEIIEDVIVDSQNEFFFTNESFEDNDNSASEFAAEEPVAFVPESINETETYDDEDDLFSFIDDIKFDEIPDSISSNIDDLLPDTSNDMEDDFNGFKVDLDSIEDINPDNNDDEDDIASLFDSMFED